MSFANAPISFGSRTAIRQGERKNTGIALSTSTFASEPISFGSRNAARRTSRRTLAPEPRIRDLPFLNFRDRRDCKPDALRP